MKKLLVMFFLSFLVLGIQAQESSDKKEKSKKEKKDKSSKKGEDDADVFIGEPEGEDYQIEDRKEVSKPLMPLYSEEQEFNQMNKKKEQQDAYMNNEYYFPAKPKNAWQLGLRGGISLINGDVNQNFFKGNKPFVPGYTFGVTVSKPFSYMFSMRLNYDFMEMWNTDWQQSTLTEDLIRHTNYSLVSYVNDNPYGNSDIIYHNSHTVAHDATLDAVISFGNVRFHKERTKVIFNAFVSGGGFLYQTWYDHLDDNGNPYDYRSVLNATGNQGDKKEVIQALQDMRNGVYETKADGHVDAKNGSFIGEYSFRPVFGGGFGMTFRLNRFINLDIQTRMMFTRDDLLDGHRWQEPDGNSVVSLPTQFGGGSAKTSRALTRTYDTYNNTTIGITFKLAGKKKTEPTTLLNPMHFAYQKMAENNPENVIEELLKDDDEDGVPNRLDQELDSPKGAPVSTKGIALDSDADGIIDLNDEEPYSPPGVPVNAKGVAQLPPPVIANNGACCSCDNVILPSVHFDKDKFNIKPEFYAHLHDLAEKLNTCPDLKIKATGMTDKDDDQKYNEQLSWNRVNAVIDYLEEKYGISRDRFIINYLGESNASSSSTIEQYKERKVLLEQAKEGETGSSNPAPPHPSIKAGTDK
jgi:outer membrane protein OmpA-like peptidoglycan-associated protein